MRDKVIAKIEALRDNRMYNAYRLTGKEHKNSGRYLGNDDWKKLDDDALLDFFVSVSGYAHKQM